MICKRFYISGKVQGVWYRASTQKMASELGLTGWAKNLPDERVEVVACGEPEVLATLENWLWVGPPLAVVEEIQITEEPVTHFENFVTI